VNYEGIERVVNPNGVVIAGNEIVGVRIIIDFSNDSYRVIAVDREDARLL
jgi:hypothetical protein